MEFPALTAPVLILIMGVSAASAHTWYIEPDGTGDAPTIQAGIDSAIAGDTVVLADGTFTGPGNRDLDYGGKAIVVRSENQDPGLCIIECGGGEAEHHRGFIFTSGEGSGSVLEGLTVAGGYGDDAGAVYLSGNSCPVIANCVFSDNFGQWSGGAISCWNASPAISDCEFLRNSTTMDGSGGAMVLSESNTTVSNCVFRDNVAYQGAGVYCQMADLTFEDCIFIGNSAEWGGGVYICCSQATILMQCILSGNSADHWGGGILSGYNGSALVTGCTLVGNHAGNHGSGIANQSTDTTTVENTIIAYGTGSEPVACLGGVGPTVLSCCDVYGNEVGDWWGCLESQEGVDGNFSACPSMCGIGLEDFHLCDQSPCAAGNHPDHNACGLIGAWGVSCSCGPTATRATTWGALKSMYR